MKLLKALLFSSAVSFFLPQVLFSLTIPELQKKIRDQDHLLKAVQFEYTQEMKSSQSQEMVQTKGKAYFKKPQSLRIEQSTPDKQVIIASKKSVYIYTPKFKQVLKDSWKNWSQKNSFLPGLFGSSGTLERLEKNFDWEMGTSQTLNGEETLNVKLVSNTPEADEGLLLWLGAKDFIPRRAEYSTNGLTLVTSLVSLKVNPKLKTELFTFSQPKDSVLINVP